MIRYFVYCIYLFIAIYSSFFYGKVFVFISFGFFGVMYYHYRARFFGGEILTRSILLLIALGFYYYLGYGRFYEVNVVADIGYTVMILSLFILSYSVSDSGYSAISVYLVFSLGMVLLSAIMVGYTLYRDPGLLLARSVITPMSHQVVNVPQYSNYAVFSSLFAVYYLIKEKRGMLVKIMLYLVILVGASVNILFQARTFFLVLSLSFVYFMYRRFDLKVVIRIVAFIVFLIVLYDAFNIGEILYVENAFGRYSDEQLESARYDLNIYGLKNAIDNPMAQLPPSFGNSTVLWYHNLWLDMVRTSSVIPLFFFIIFHVAVLKDLLLIRSVEKDLYIWIYIVFNMIMFTSIPLEAKQVDFLFYIIFAGMVLRLRKNDEFKIFCDKLYGLS